METRTCGRGLYRLVAKHVGRVLDVNMGQGDQANEVQHTWHEGDNQPWTFESVVGGYFRIIAKHSGEVLNVNLGKGDQANVVQHGWHGGDNPKWKFEALGNGYYRIAAKHSGKVLDVNQEKSIKPMWSNMVGMEGTTNDGNLKECT